MNFRNVREKVMAVIHRMGRRTTVAVCAVLLVGAAVVLNLLLYDGENGQKKKLAVDLDAMSAGNVENSSAEDENTAVYNYFDAMELSRQQARDEAMEVLMSLAESASAVEEMKSEAMAEMAQIARDMESEANIETLILSKGFQQCVAVVSGDTASVIVKSGGLLPNEIAQISEIVYEQTGIVPSNLKIIEKDV